MAEDSIKRFYVRNVDVWKNILPSGKTRFSDNHPSVKIIENGIVLPARTSEVGYAGGVCDNDFNFVAGYTRRVPPLEPNRNVEYCDLLSSYTVDREQIVRLDEDVIFGGALRSHFGHFMVEGLCRLWYVMQHPELKLKIVFIHYRGAYHKWFDAFFISMGIDKERIVYVNQPTQFRSIIIPDQSAYAPRMFMKEFLIPYQAIKEHVAPSEHKKIYLTRTQLPKRVRAHVYNEKYFENFFATHGFKIIAMEKLSIEEQLSLITGADEIASTMGTLTHWVLFCKPTAKFIMLPRTHTTQSLFFQFFIHEAINPKNVYIVDVSKDFMYAVHNGGMVLIGSTKHWKEFVADYFGEEIAEDDDKEYLGTALEKYTDGWCRKYVGEDSKNFNIIFNSFWNMCTRIFKLENEQVKSRSLLKYQTHISKDGLGTTSASEEQISNPINQNGSTKNWKEFVADYFGEDIAEDNDSPYFGTALDEYTDGWCRRYVGEDSANFNIILRSLRDMCKRIITLENEQVLNRPLLKYQTHVAKFGWGTTWAFEERISNLIAQKRDIQAVKIKFSRPFCSVLYSVYYNETEGWSKEVSNGAMAGTTGKGKSIFGIKIRLDDSGGGAFDILYRVHTFDGQWTPWAQNGAELLSNGVKLNALQIKLVSK